MDKNEFTDFVRTQLNPILGACFHEGAGRVQFGGGTERPTPGIEFLRNRTDELTSVLSKRIKSLRELKGSRNFPGADPSPDYDRGIEDAVHALLLDICGDQKENS